MRNLGGQVAVVTGGTFGVGRGIVFVTGRSAHDGVSDDGQITGIRCDHRRRHGDGEIDILVNNVWGGYEGMVEDGTFTWTKPFWEHSLWRWDAMFSAGVRAH